MEFDYYSKSHNDMDIAFMATGESNNLTILNNFLNERKNCSNDQYAT